MSITIWEWCIQRSLDLFASRSNKQLDNYVSWNPDPECKFVDAFSINLEPYKFYAFAPFSLLPSCLQKIQRDQATDILIVPLWPTQAWFPNIFAEGECVKFGTHHVVTRFMKAVFETKNPARKCTTTWDVSKVLKYLATLYPNNRISFKCLSIKLVLLMLLLSGQRGQTIHLLNLAGLNIIDDTCVFQLLEHIKTSKPGGRATVLSFKKYTENHAVCPVLTLKIIATHKVAPKRREATVY